MKKQKLERGASKDQILIQVPSELKCLVVPIRALLDSAKAAMRACSGGRAVDYVAIEQTVEDMAAAVERSTHETILRSLEVDSPRGRKCCDHSRYTRKEAGGHPSIVHDEADHEVR